jgi:ATP-dependent DNA ligase
MPTPRPAPRRPPGATVFYHAWRIGLEGIILKRLTALYRSGHSSDWLKVKNPDSPAISAGAGGGVVT